jgi:hypothetical protein
MERAQAAGLAGQPGAAGHPAILEERLREVRDALAALEAELAREPDADGLPARAVVVDEARR